MMLIKQETLMNWRRYRKALLPTEERPGIRVVRLIRRDKVRMNRCKPVLGPTSISSGQS
jgi:hypothetical protein